MSVHVYHVCAWCPWKSEEGARSLGRGVMASYEPLCRFWEPNPGLFARATSALNCSPSLQSQDWVHNDNLLTGNEA